ncbi:MAG: ferric reductase-like transmembrane domain-containing protein [Planctomycetota bacterium]|nr:ferric reductase-like transmembrane domain-containing protein [Planctomycetota bacterium]
MSATYRFVNWNRHKRVYNAAIAAGALLYVAGFVVISRFALPAAEGVGDEVLIMRALGSCALVLLHVILAIGPLVRLDRRFAALLYNRRHLGVTMFLLALAHALLALLYYGGFGVQNPIEAIFAAPLGPAGPPFEIFGLAALAILFLMAATSHDFWLATLSPRLWKWLHMLVYLAYALLIAHVSFGALHSDRSPLLAAALAAGVLLLTTLHIAAARRSRPPAPSAADQQGWIDLGPPAQIPGSRARLVCLPQGGSVAVFRDGNTFSAISNVCAHQGGPLAEGKIVSGCVTCPWHGYQYIAASGTSPPPYTEKLPTYQLRISAGRLMLNPRANPPGTHVTPAEVAP